MKISGIVSTIKRELVKSEGKVTQAEIYLTNTATSEEIQLSMPPEKISVKTDANFRSWNVVEIGEVKLPKGERLTQINWRGTLPGAYMLLSSIVNLSAWQEPQELIKVLKRWRENGEKIKLLITQTPVNMDVFIKSFDYEASGGQGNYNYTLELIAAKEMQVMTVAEADAQRAARENELNSRAGTRPDLGEKLATIDNIWSLTKILTGNGTLSDVEKVLGKNGKSLDDFDGGDLIIWG